MWAGGGRGIGFLIGVLALSELEIDGIFWNFI